MAIKVKGFEAAEATTPNLDAVTTEGNTTTNSITVGGVSIGTAYSLPTSDGAANQVLQTDGSGGVTFQTLDVTGGLEYKGSFNATAGTPSLANAEKGDFYVVDTAGTIYGQTWVVGDHLLINEDMGGTITNSKIDKIDNTDQVTSVNGQTGAVTLTASDVSALASGDNVSELTNDAGYLTSAPVTSVNTQTGAVTLTASDVSALASGDNVSELTNDAGYLTSAPVTSVNSLTGAVTISGDDIAADHTATNYTAANANVDGHLSGIDTALGTALAPTLDSVTDNGATTTNDISVGGIISAGNIVSDADGTRTLGTEANRYITLFGDVNGAVRFKAKNDSGSAMTKGQVVYIKGVSGDVPTVDLADADVSSKMPAFGLVYANANDQAEVQIVSFGNLTGLNTSAFSAGDTLFVSTTAGTLTATKPSGESAALQNIGRVVRSHASEGVVIVGGAGRSAATPNLDQNKIFLGNASNQAVSTALSSIALSSLNDDLSYLEPANNLSDVANAATARTNLGLAIGSDVQAYDAQLADVAGLTPTDGNIIIGNGTNFITESGATARTSLGLGTAATEDVGTTANDIVQLDGSARLPAVDGSQLTNLPSGVTTLGGLSDVTLGTLASGEVLKYNGSNWVDSALTASDVSALAIANNLSDVANAATARTNLGLAIGSDVQAYDAQLADVAGLTPTDGNIIIGNGTNFITESGATARTSLGLGTAATEDVGTTANDIVQLDGSARLPAVDGSQLTNLPSGGGLTYTVVTSANFNASANTHAHYIGGSANTWNVTLPATSGLSSGDVFVFSRTYNGTTVINKNAADANCVVGVKTSSAAASVTIDSQPSVFYFIFDGTNFRQAQVGLGSGAELDADNSANNLLKLDFQGRLPSIDGSQLTNLPYVPTEIRGAGGTALNLTASLKNIVYWLTPSTGATFTITLPLTTTLSDGDSWTIQRQTTGNLVIQQNGSDTGTKIRFGATDAASHTINAAGQSFLVTYEATASKFYIFDQVFLQEISTDTTPQLGGDLDLNGNDLVTTNNADLDLAPDGTGVVVVRGNDNSGAIKLNCEQNSHGVTIQGPAHSANATYTLTLPVNDGDADQVLKTDGSGVLSWVDQAGGGGGGLTYSAITANTTAQADYHYSCTGSITLTLPTSGISAGSEIRVKNMGTGTITIDPQTGTIDGSTTDRTLTDQYSALILISTGTNWEII